MKNGRCKMHGGLTPAGAGWHRIRVPERGEVRGLEKYEAKLVAKEKRDARRHQRLAAMTPEARAKHHRWHETHPPGSPAERAHRRRQRETKAMLDELLTASASEPVDVFS